jgi:hypothetical protein
MFVLGMNGDGCDWMFVAEQAAVIRDPEARRTQGHVVRKPKSIVRDQETRQLTKTSISLAYDENRRRPEGGGRKKVQPSSAAGKYRDKFR